MRRCADLVTAFDKDRPTAEPPGRRHRLEDEIPVADTATRKLGEPERRPLRTVVDAAGRLLRPRDQVRYVGAVTKFQEPHEPAVRTVGGVHLSGDELRTAVAVGLNMEAHRLLLRGAVKTC